jgi:ParB-like chromosome segregation protein Spo0J
MITIPTAELVNIQDLQSDGNNPNVMTPKQHKRLSTSITKYGFVVPIITNKDLLIADGEQRWQVAKALNMTQVPVIRLPVSDVDRRLLRQVLNKLKGEHDLMADALEFEKICEAGRTDDLKHLLDLDNRQLEKYLSEVNPPDEESYKTDLEQIEPVI